MVDPLKVLWVLTNSTYLVTKFIRTETPDRAENPPFFEQSHYEVDVEENAKLHTSILTVVASSSDPGAQINYGISNGNLGGSFSIDKNSGVISTAGTIDYETKDKYELVVSAKDREQEAQAMVTVRVLDVNDNPPIFERPTYRTQIMEEDDRNLPKRILQVVATDADKDRPRNIIYFLTGPGIDPDNPANSKFDINGTSGEIFVLKALDRDPPHGRPQWRFTVFAQDEGGEGLVGYAEIHLSLKDVNDNAPNFPREIYWGNVTENATEGVIVMTMSAIDNDDANEGTNARLVYSIEKNVIDEDTGTPIFDIESKTGIIRTAMCCLDRERTSDYSIQIVAMDGGGLKGTGTASIRVLDINDMSPNFSKDEWMAEVDETDSENLPETSVLIVTVHDGDEISNFQYKVVGNSGFGADRFTMTRNPDNTGSLKIIKSLDYEDPLQRNGFRFKIKVSDKDVNENDKNHEGYAWVNIKLRDVNDNLPHFENQNMEVSVLENVEVGRNIGQFQAIDIDNSGETQISYKIDRMSDVRRQFHISQTGTVSVQRALDREEMKTHKIKILAIDDGSPPKTGTATLTVQVDDVNDNAPNFRKDYRPVLEEHSPPQKIVEIEAMDKDDKSKGNGAPFTFKMDPEADDIIKSSFKVEYDSKNEGIAIVSSLRTFDREHKKEYHIPIVTFDSGKPQMSGTSTLTVIIGDINDNKMHPGTKEIFVYNYLGQAADTEVGRVFVNDLDDWDLSDKKFYWDGAEHLRFKLNEDTGMITMRHGTQPNRYNLKFRVYDHKYSQADIPANVSVIVKNIPHEAIINSGSIRIFGSTDEDFIKVWDYSKQKVVKSKSKMFEEHLAQLLQINNENVDVFSVQLFKKNPPITDIHFSAHSHSYFKPARLNGVILLNREKIEKELDINITMVGIDECLYENRICEGSCTNKLEINKQPYMVNVNKTSLVGVRLSVTADCVCAARNFSRAENCHFSTCYNNGQCIQEKNDVRCLCKRGLNGPRCQQTTRSFKGTGWAWYPPLAVCDQSHLSLEFLTTKADGMLLYNGPIVPPETEEILISDFISLELENGMPRLLIDFGSGTLQLRVKTKKSLNDGEWHRLDVIWDTKKVRLVVDFCKSAEITEGEDGKMTEFNDTNCQAVGTIPPFNEYLNVNTPLQIGGLYAQQIDPMYYHWQFTPVGKSFDGCIKYLIFNSQMYDLGEPGLSKNSESGCSKAEKLCKDKDLIFGCEEHGSCISNFNDAWCECHPGWTGLNCLTPTIPATFKLQSYVKYALSFEPDLFSTQLQLRFRTREEKGELFRISDQHNKEYGILEIKQSHLQFRYNLNSISTEEKYVSLSAISVNDGKWHTAKVSRYGSVAILELDGGEGRKYNESFIFSGHQLLPMDKQEGIYAGGKAEYIGVRMFEVHSDFHKGCLDDIVLEGKHLPLPPAMNGTQWGQATMARNLERYCHSNKSCMNITCPEPLVCVDLWNDFECNCGDGWILTLDQKGCTDRNECFDKPCQNGGTCVNQEPKEKYRCLCSEDYWGRNCELSHEPHTLKLSIGALSIILASLLVIIVLVLIFAVYNHQRIVAVKPPPPDDVRENIITYNDEGGGEDDMTVFDIKPLQVPMAEAETEIGANISDKCCEDEITKYKKKFDSDSCTQPCDDLRNYAFEGGGSISGSLSSLASSIQDNEQDYEFLNNWGPRFEGLAQMYNKRVIKEREITNQKNFPNNTEVLKTQF